jgi:prevent-host-death family protein
MALTVTLDDARNRFPQLLERVLNGAEEVIIAEAGTPVARLVPVPAQATRRQPGSARGQVVIAPDFDAPLPPDVLDAFEQ